MVTVDVVVLLLCISRCIGQQITDPRFGADGVVVTRALQDNPSVGVERVYVTIALDGGHTIGCGRSNMSQIPVSQFAFCYRLDEAGTRVANWGNQGSVSYWTPVGVGFPNTYVADAKLIGGSVLVVGNAEFSGPISTLVCKIDVASGAQVFCTLSVPIPSFKVEAVRLAFIGARMFVLNRSPSYEDPGGVQTWFIDEHNLLDGSRLGNLFTSGSPPPVVGGWLVRDMISAQNLLNVAVWTLPSNCQVVSVSLNGSVAGVVANFPFQAPQCGVESLALDDQGRILVGGHTNDFGANNLGRASLWRLVPQGNAWQLDSSFGVNGAIVFPKPSSLGAGNLLTTRVVYDQAFRIVVFARHRDFFTTTNDNTIVLYRRYSSDGGVDASWNYGGDVARVAASTSFSEDVLTSSVDQLYRVLIGGSRVIIFSNVSSSLRRDDSLFVRFISQVGNCTLGGNVCACSSNTLCQYDGFVFVVQNATTRPASIVGDVLFRPGIVLASNGSIGAVPLVTSTGAATIGSGTSLVVSLNVQGDGQYVLLQAQSLAGQFSLVDVNVSDSSCRVGAPVYSSTSLSVTISGCYAGLQRGAIAGIVVGCVVGAILIGVGIALLTKAIISHRTAQMGAELRQKELVALGATR